MTHLVIGSGLLGQAIIKALLERGESVRVLDLNAHDNPQTHNITGDIRDRDTVRMACEGVHTVYHTAALVSQSLGRPVAMYDVNVGGTDNIITACQEQGVRHLVYSSSIDVVFDGTSIRNGDERLPYPRRHLDYYGETKMIAEQHVLAANGASLRSVSLRVGGLYGPNDHQRFPPIIALARQGAFVRLGDGRARFNHVYVGNAAHAHLLAAEALGHGESPVHGGRYFITDYEASNFFDFVQHYLDQLHLPIAVRRVPYAVAALIAQVYAWRYRLLPLPAFAAPTLTRYVVAATCQDFWFSHQQAARDFGYQPVISLDTAEARTLTWLRQTYLP